MVRRACSLLAIALLALTVIGNASAQMTGWVSNADGTWEGDVHWGPEGLAAFAVNSCLPYG